MKKELIKPAQYIAVGVILIISLSIATFTTGKALLKEQQTLATPTQDITTASGNACDIAVIPLVGQLWASDADATGQTAADNSANTSAENILQSIEYAQDNDAIRGVVLRIDSAGGSGVAGNLIAEALKRLTKPSVALIWNQGDSAAYLAATGANTIIASPNSDIGDIGVTGSYLDQSGQNTKNGQKFITIAAGAYKDVGNPNNPLTSVGKALLQKQVDQMYQNFIQEVAQNRSMSVSAVKAVANGVSYIASTALNTGLIDSLGDSETAREWFAQKLGEGEAPVLCE